MRPKGIESNHFAYHLEQLLKAGLVIKEDRTYSLTTEGLAFADRASHADMSVRKQPHIVSTVQITNNLGQTLLFKHAFQPYLNKVGYPQGRTHFDEDIGAAAARELAEKSSLTNVPLIHRGIVYITTKQGDEIISKLMAHIFSGTVEGQPDVQAADNRKGSVSWGSTDGYDDAQCMPGFLHITKLLKTTAPDRLFFDEVIAEIR